MALMILGRTLESAASLDAFLLVHPFESLPSDQRARITSNRQPGTLRVEGGIPGAEILVDEVSFGTLPRGEIWLPRGSHRVAWRMSGETHDAGEVDLSGPDAVAITLPSPTPVDVAPAPATLPEATPGTEPASTTSTPEPEPSPPRRGFLVSETAESPTDWTPYAIGFGAATGVFLVGGVVAAIWAEERAQTYVDLCATPLAGCDAVLSEYDTADALRTTSFVLAGATAVATTVFVVLHLTQPANEASPSAYVCAPTLGGLRCEGRF